jgi:polar amino acid transport system substrate-binding protein
MIRCAGESVHGRNLAAFAPRDTMEEAGSKETHHGRERYMRTKLSLVSIFAAIAAVVMLEAAPAAAESTWDQIKRTGQLRYGAIDYPPNWYRDKTSGKWTGFLVEMVEDIAKEMGVEAVPVETTWATCVLDLQSNKTDLQFGLQATPKRALVIDFAGPAYNLYWYAVNHKGLKATTWEDYNKPEVKVAAMLGSADVVILQKVAPKATRVELNDVASIALAVTSGRADAMVTAVFGALVAKNRNPDLGDFVLPTPTVYLPSYVGLRREDNNTLQKFLHTWAEWNNLLGYTEGRIKKYLESAGATNIPENVRF